MSMKSDKGDSKNHHSVISIPQKDAIAIIPPKKVSSRAHFTPLLNKLSFKLTYDSPPTAAPLLSPQALRVRLASLSHADCSWLALHELTMKQKHRSSKPSTTTKFPTDLPARDIYPSTKVTFCTSSPAKTTPIGTRPAIRCKAHEDSSL